MNERDLRVIKTRENIENALLELLKKKRIDKVTVVELSRLARINKSTFYLHYQDIHDLYRQTVQKRMEDIFRDADYFPLIFQDPELFLYCLGRSMVPGIDNLYSQAHIDRNLQSLHDIMAILIRKVYETGMIDENEDNNLNLEILFSSLAVVMKERHEYDLENSNKRFASIIRFLFPDECQKYQGGFLPSPPKKIRLLDIPS